MKKYLDEKLFENSIERRATMTKGRISMKLKSETNIAIYDFMVDLKT